MRPHPLLVSILAVLSGCNESEVIEGCLTLESEEQMCPAPKDVDWEALRFSDHCKRELELVEVKGPPTRGPGSFVDPETDTTYVTAKCCYPVEVIDIDPGTECIPGRPYFEGGTLLEASVRSRHQRKESVYSDTQTMARAWARAGAAEHASVAAFNRLSLQLMALGAPLELLAAVQQAALEEVHHADACLRLAELLGGSSTEMSAFPFRQAVNPHISLEKLAFSAVREGCLAETLGALVTAFAAEHAADERVRSVLLRLAREEAEHSVLSFRVVAWALSAGGETVRQSVSAALSQPWPTVDAQELATRAGLPAALIEQAANSARQQVLLPATRALLAERGQTARNLAPTGSHAAWLASELA